MSSRAAARKTARLGAGLGVGLGVAALVLCFGLVGAILSLPVVRRRLHVKRRRCARCRGRYRVGRAAVASLSVLLLAGAAVRADAALRPPILCHSRVSPDGGVVSEPLLQVATAGSSPWNVVRRTVVAPASGIGLAAGRIAGMHVCAGPPLLVTFWWPPRVDGGSTVGDVFITWIPLMDDASGAPQETVVGLAAETSYERFGPNIETRYVSEEQLAQHESRHLNQWAIFTIAAGPLAFPVAYFLDNAFFPYNRSHFERWAGLADGGYEAPSDTGPAPLPGPTILISLALASAVCLRLGRALRRSTRKSPPPGVCKLHSESNRDAVKP